MGLVTEMAAATRLDLSVERAEEENMLIFGSSCFSLDQESAGEQERSTVSYRFPAGVDLGTSCDSYLLSQGTRRPLESTARSPGKTKHSNSSIPKLPPLAAGKDLVLLHPVSEVQDDISSLESSFNWSKSGGLPGSTGRAMKTPLAKPPSLISLCSDLHLLIESLVDLKDQLSRSNVESSALDTLCATLLPAHRELKGVVNRLTSQGRHASDPLVTGESLQLMMLYVQLIIQALMEQSKQLKGVGPAHGKVLTKTLFLLH